MKNSTFKNAAVIAALNDNFYFIAFDAEGQEDINLKGRKFIFKKKGISSGLHELADELASVNGQISYPSFVILNDNWNILIQKQSVLSPEELISMLQKIK